MDQIFIIMSWLQSTKLLMKQKHGPKNLKNLDYQPAELKTETLSDENKSDLKHLTSLKQVKLSKIQILMWWKSSKKDFGLLIRHVADNLDNYN